MKNLNLKNIGVSELKVSDARRINGGILPIIVGVIVLAFTIGYSDGRRDKK